ncbi:conserved exported protein of unknown function [Ralstonia solanacearum CMR15]|nr:conserved exported protein of unknown function [Ralstonia solanacearum CMR15]
MEFLVILVCTVVSVAVVFGGARAFDRFISRWVDAEVSDWRHLLRLERRHLLIALDRRQEAYALLDGDGLVVADEHARRALVRLGGLAGAW